MASNAEVYEKVTARLVAAIERGVLPWRNPWRVGMDNGVLPCNGVTRRAYSGVNIMVLMFEAMNNGYTSRGWVTFNQARSAGGSVRKGEKSTPVMFMSKIRVAKGTPDEKDIFLARLFNVFNLDQTKGLEKFSDRLAQPTFANTFEACEALEDMVSATGARIEHGGDKACYIPFLDQIQMPLRGAFKDGMGYYGVLAHELIHWTGHDSREDRLSHKTYGAGDTYAMEELVAEIGAAFVGAHYGIDTLDQSAPYLAHWLAKIKQDPRALVHAASAASRAITKYLITAEVVEEEEEVEA